MGSFLFHLGIAIALSASLFLLLGLIAPRRFFPSPKMPRLWVLLGGLLIVPVCGAIMAAIGILVSVSDVDTEPNYWTLLLGFCWPLAFLLNKPKDIATGADACAGNEGLEEPPVPVEMPDIKGVDWNNLPQGPFKVLSRDWRAARKHFRNQAKLALEDNRLTDDESAALLEMQRSLGLPDDTLKTVRLKHFQRVIKPIVSEVRRTQSMSAEQEQELHEIAENLCVNFEFENSHIYRALWDAESEGGFNPKPIDVPIRLQKGETCFHFALSSWQQERRVRQHRGYRGGSVGITVAKGVRVNLGRAEPIVDVSDELVEVSSGTLYVTNKRIVFVGDKKSTNIASARIMHAELFSDAILIYKSSGKPDTFIFYDDLSARYVACLIENF